MDRRALWQLLLIGLGTMVVPLDNSLNIAFPPITAHFGLPLPRIQWMVICYVLTYGSLMLGIGRLGDIFGHALVFRLGLGWGAVAFLLCTYAPDYEGLLAGRVMQGIGAALVISCGPALVTSLFPESQRARVLGLYALLFAAGGVLGPSVGGWLVAEFGWQATFWFRIPVALTALLLLRGLPAPPRPAVRESFDLPGAVLLTLSIATLLLAVNRARQPELALPIAAGFLLCLAAFLWRSRRSPRPIIALHLFRLPGFALLNIANALVNFSGFAVLLLVPYYLERIAAMPTMVAGLVLAVSPAGSMLVSAPSGWLLGRVPAPRMACGGIALVGAGLALIACWGQGSGSWLLLLALLLHGAGLGLLQVSYTDIVTATLPRQDRGVAGSLAMMTRTLGVVSAASLLTLLFGHLQSSALAAGMAVGDAFLQGFRGSFLLAAAIPLLLLPVLLRRLR